VRSRLASLDETEICAALETGQVYNEIQASDLESYFSGTDKWIVRSLLPDEWLPSGQDAGDGAVAETLKLIQAAEDALESNDKWIIRGIHLYLPPASLYYPHAWSYTGSWSFKTGPLIAIHELNDEVGEWVMDTAAKLLLLVGDDEQLLGAVRS